MLVRKIYNAMTILWIYNLPLRPEAGGTERITSLIARGLASRGHHSIGILVFDEYTKSMTYCSKPVLDLYMFLNEHKVDVVINQIAYSNWLLDSFLDNGGRKWRQEGGRIISCLHFDPKNPSLLFLLRGKTKKNLFDRICILKAAILYEYYKVKQKRKEGSIYNHIYEESDWFVTLSRTHFAYLYKVMKRNEYSRLVAINNPLTFDGISNPDVVFEKKKIVLVCARMSEYHKRISIILKTWKMLQKSGVAHNWTLLLLGDGPDLERYKKYVRLNKIQNIKFEGQQSPEPYYRTASIMLLTSSAEGWGLTITESLQRGVVPIVMNSSPVFEEMIQDGTNGFITPNNNIKMFKNRIKELMTDATVLRNMQFAALTSAEAFSLEKTMVKWDKIIS